MIQLGRFTFFIYCVIVSFTSVLSAQPSVGGKTAFLYFGDFGTGDKEQKQVANTMVEFCRSNACDFVLSVGDNFYPAGVSATNDPKWKTHFHDMYDKLGLAFYAILGNHDYGGNIDAQIKYSAKSPLWILPQRYYTFQHGEIDFFALDTNAFDNKQAEWLTRALKGSKAKWKIVFGHHPIYSFGKHGNSPKLIEKLLPILEDRAHFYLAGHDHDKQVLKGPNGLGLMVSGAVAQIRPVSQGPATLFASSTLGFMHFEIDDKTANLRVLDVKGQDQFKKTYSPSTRETTRADSR